MSLEDMDQAEENAYFLPQRQWRRGPLPPGPAFRPDRGEDILPPDLEGELYRDPTLFGRQWRRGPLSQAGLDPARVSALWNRRHGTDE